MSENTIYLLYISHSEKVQAEIDREIGQSRQPCLADRVNMPYTDAVIHEIQRFGNVVPLGFPKQAVKDTTLGEYFIPKVFILFYSILFWGLVVSRIVKFSFSLY